MTSFSFVSVSLLALSLLASGCEAPSATGTVDGKGLAVEGAPGEQPSAENLQTAELMVEGTSCASCTVTIRRHLNKLAGVSDIREGQSKQHVMVDFDPEQVSPEQIVQAVHEAGYEAEVLVYAKKS